MEEKNITSISLQDEMQRSYLEYAMSVIVGRALPDARDGRYRSRVVPQPLRGWRPTPAAGRTGLAPDTRG